MMHVNNQDSNQVYKFIFESSLDAILLTAPDGSILGANPVAETLFEYSQEELCKLGRSGLVDIKDPQLPILLEERRLNGKAKGELTFIRKSGERFSGLIFSHIFQDENGYERTIMIIRDLTETKKTEKAFKDSETYYRVIFDNAGDGILLMNGEHFIECNEKALEIYGATRNQIIGQTPTKFSPKMQGPGLKSEDMGRKFIKHALQGHPQNFEWKHMRLEGTPFFAEVTLNRLKIEDEYLIQAMVRDVTLRKETEDLLKKSEHRYKMVGQLISDFAYSCVHNLDGIYEIDWITDSFYHISGFNENEIKLKQCWVFTVHPEDEKIAHNQLKELKAGSTNVSIFRIKNINGEVRWIKNHVKCVEDNHSDNLRIYGAAQDITQLKQREETIEKSLREKEVLLQEIHHRVKNNMQIISSLLNLQSHNVSDEAANILDQSKNRVKTMALVHEKLYQSPNLSKIDMIDYIQSLVSNLFYSFNFKKGQIIYNTEIESIGFNIETALPCGLIINELVSNSFKHAFPNERKGKINISLNSKAGQYELIIKDNGIGLPNNLDVENIDSLGLQLVNSLIDQLDADIEIDKTHGTKFIINFSELNYKKRI
ncbi:MAG: PAS domain S-box protein [Methanobacteriaceae archaeon]|nr:PAS domain S-box protein [Methanobacteriaceae archaeon]MDP3484415.1 PAS domain S-box protein [Methanobacteriaceae archaeon]MDP3623453.1 PAS domain S-box protein [Methanobacteriaceae archaeon]